MCNGLTEKFNGTMKLMFTRLCSEQPKQWHRCINPLWFAYREVSQASTGFSPFELLYGRAVRRPMTILKELWTKEVEEPEVKNSYQYVFELREKLPYASPVVVMKTKDSTNRVYVDYRKLNKLTVIDPEPMPTAEKLFRKLSGDTFFYED